MLWFIYFTYMSFGAHLQANAMWIKSFIRMSCQYIRLLATIFSASRTMPPYLQYGKELFASWSCQHSWLAIRIHIYLQSTTSGNFVTGGYMTCIPIQLPYYPTLNASWLNKSKAFHRGIQLYNQASSKHANRLTECINKSCGHTRYDLQYINV